MNSKKKLIVIAGPTAVGKTNLSIQLAQQLNTVIISADSRQVYKELSIGTAKPSKEEQKNIPHYFIDHLSIEQNFSAGQYEKEVLQLLENLFQYHNEVILCGGSGLFIRAVCEGFDEVGNGNPEIRKELQDKLSNQGISHLHAELKKLDPEYYKIVDKNNPQRVIRALEVCLTSGQSYSSLRSKKNKSRPFEIYYFLLDMPREKLYERINNRVDEMIEAGLENEAKSVYPFRANNALQTVGYKEFFDYFDGNTDLNTCIEKIKQNSRNYAKRQLTWFRNQGDFKLIIADSNALSQISESIKN